MKLGQQYTIAGLYKRRTLGQWLKGEPKHLKQYIIKDVCSSYSVYETLHTPRDSGKVTK